STPNRAGTSAAARTRATSGYGSSSAPGHTTDARSARGRTPASRAECPAAAGTHREPERTQKQRGKKSPESSGKLVAPISETCAFHPGEEPGAKARRRKQVPHLAATTRAAAFAGKQSAQAA